MKLTPLREQNGQVAHVAQSISTPTSHNTTAHRPSDLNLCSARVLPAPPTADTPSRAWGGERERDEVGVTSVVQFVRARAPCGLLAGGRAICYIIFFFLFVVSGVPRHTSFSVFAVLVSFFTSFNMNMNSPFTWHWPYWPLDSLIFLEEEEKLSNIPGMVFPGLVLVLVEPAGLSIRRMSSAWHTYSNSTVLVQRIRGYMSGTREYEKENEKERQKRDAFCCCCTRGVVPSCGP